MICRESRSPNVPVNNARASAPQSWKGKNMNNQTYRANQGLTLMKFSLFAVTTMTLVFGAFAADKAKQNQGNPGIVPPNQQGLYMQLQADWWQWVSAIPANKNPLLDATGENAAVGQQGPIWFLAGTFGGVAERTCQVPAGKALFFPIVNCVYVHNLKEDPKEKEQRAMIKEFIDGAFNLSCTIDGQQVNNLDKYRFQSPVFKVTVPENNIYGIEKGTFPAVDDGCYLLLEPLPAGVHTIQFHAEAAWGQVTVTYHLTVADEL
jgi:hypothetical protein